MTKIFVRNVSVRKLLDNLFVSAIASVLGIRVFLFVTGYPYIGGEILHIAHMLWGGLMMIAANILLIAFLGRRVQHFAAILGGVGFGFFIDELGKFITLDNDYFYRPTFMLMYLIFVGLYFIIRELDKSLELNEEERLVNALEISKEAVMKHFDEKERKQMIALLTGKHSMPLFGHLRQLLDHTVLIPKEKPWWAKLKAQSLYEQLVNSKFFSPLIVAMTLFQGALIVTSFLWFGEFSQMRFLEQIIITVGLASAGLSVIFVLKGLVELRKDRFQAFQKFYRANLVSVLITQPFAFYVAAFLPTLALGISLAAMVSLQYLAKQEQKLKSRQR